MSELTHLAWERLPKPNAAAASVLRPASAAAPVQVACYRDLASIARAWQAMGPNAVSTVFQTFELFAAWATHIAPTQNGTWFVIVASYADRAAPCLLLPLYRHSRGGVVVIEPVDLGISDFNGPVLARDFSPSRVEMAAMWSTILRVLPHCDLIQLSKMPSHIGPNPNPLLLLGNVQRMKLSNFKTSLTLPSGTWTPDRLPTAVYDDVSRRRRKLNKRAKITLRTAQNVAEADAFFAAMLEQRATRCVAMGRTNLLDCPNYRAFYRNLIKPGDPASIGCIHALTADEEIIATGYSLIGNMALHMIFPTFKGERWRNYSPGMQLFVDTMSWAAANGFTTYDFTIGDESFKAELGADQCPLFEYLVAITVRGRPTVYHDRLRRFVRNNPRLLAIVVRWRQTISNYAAQQPRKGIAL